jgi:carboxypeptidase PM20D1
MGSPLSQLDDDEFNNALETLKMSLRVKTVSSDSKTWNNSVEFADLHRLLVDRFPLVHSQLQVTVIEKKSLLYRWNGTDPSLPAVILLSHLDLVPAPVDAHNQWDADPFSGDVLNDFVYGRGTLDDKVGVLGILEAAESYLRRGWKPRRTLFFAFGHDEEVEGCSAGRAHARRLGGLRVHFTSRSS